MANRRVHACLLGEWHDLEKEDPNCVMGINHQSPTNWFEKDAPMFGGYNEINHFERSKQQNDKLFINNLEFSYYSVPYVMVYFKGEAYRLTPDKIQIIGE